MTIQTCTVAFSDNSPGPTIAWRIRIFSSFLSSEDLYYISYIYSYIVGVTFNFQFRTKPCCYSE